jgi:hypothetical protein
MTMALGMRERGRQRPYDYRDRAMTPTRASAKERKYRHNIDTAKEHRMKRGHVTGTKRERRGASDWYKQIEEATIRKIEAEWQAKQQASK